MQRLNTSSDSFSTFNVSFRFVDPPSMPLVSREATGLKMAHLWLARR